MTNKKRLFCFGYGYTCDYLSHILRQEAVEWSIAGTTRDPEKFRTLKAGGIEAHIFDEQAPLPDPRYVLENTTHILISTPPDDEGDPAFLSYAEDILHTPSIEWVGYLSTTGVYGDRGGAWVDENSELRPSSKRGTRRALAEEQWLSLFHSHNLPVHVFRLAGIYGPGRSALDSVRAGIARRIDKPGQAFSRVHVEDIANILQTSMANPKGGSIYNICDDEPAPSHEVIAHACTLLNRPSPPLVKYEDAQLPPMAQSFYSDNKRVRNDKIKQELGITLKYPNYRDGLRGCMEAENYAKTLFGRG